ncbi:MAG: hypothetical protein QM811_28030 [Pirellulales bacterium]
MANPQRAAQLTKAHKVLKTHYKPVVADPNAHCWKHCCSPRCWKIIPSTRRKPR